ncbi:MAG: T9SS type A sorting domain-containing protein [Ignavibacteriales bacterium]|nr:T9SS type A sorting domain-containing protein [Ignavibacteriales bacterium]
MKRIYNFSFVVLFLFSLITTALFAQPDGISVAKSGNSYIVNFSLQQYDFSSITNEGKDYVEINIPGYGTEAVVGMPALPQISFNLFIPNDQQIPSVIVNSVDKSVEKLNQKVYPKQMYWSRDRSLSDKPFAINSDYYNSVGIEKPLVSFSENFVVGGVSGVMITINPFAYNPKENKLTITNSASFEVKLSSAVESTTLKSDVFNDFLENILVGYQPLRSLKSMRYLIITAPTFEAGLSSFITQKSSQGFTVDVFNTTTTGTTTTAIKAFIQARYDNEATRPEFILLVGDVQHIPSWIGTGEGTPNTDLNYAQLAGADKFADAFIGRFSVTTATELQNALTKSIYMESHIATFAKKNIFMASTDNYAITEGTHNYVIDTHFQPAGWNNIKLYTVTYNATTQQLIDALNANQRFAIYSGHGGETSWADGPVLDQSQVRSLTNTIMYPFVYSFACVTGSYHIAESFGETWIRTTNGGSTFYGSSVNSYWDEDDILEKRLIDAMFLEDLTRVTPMMDKAKFDLATHYGGVTPTVLRYMEMYNLMGDPSMPVERQIPPDSTCPNPITNLSALDATSNSLSLNWTAPYDSTFGGITSYDVRYSVNPIANDVDFDNATQRMFTGVSDSAGTARSFAVDGLVFNTTYYFAVKALDMWNNKSPMSNVPTGVTLYPPVAEVTPDSIHKNTVADTTFTENILLANTSTQNSTLDYTVELTNSTFPDNVQVILTGVNNRIEETIVDKKDFPSEYKGYSFKGSGGPDAFGYKWKDSNDPSGPDYVWNDIVINPAAVQVTTWTGTLDDGYTSAIPIGFDFKFYGNIYSNIYLSTNGFLSFAALTSSYYSNYGIPDSDVPNNIVAPFWDDLDGRTQGTVHYLREADKFTIQFTNWQKYNATGSLTFQLVLKSNDRIMFYYNNLNATLTSATVGIENGAGDDGLQIAYDATYLANNLAVQLAADPEWLTINNLSGTIYNGNSINIGLLINTEGLELGDYSMDVEIATNDPVNPLLTVPVTMTISDEVPVELVSFKADIIDENVLLNWSTATETNNSGFAIEKREKLNTKEQTEFSNVGFVEGKGTTTEKSFYSFKEKNEKPGTYLYRLKQIDFDGTFSYSNEIEILVIAPKDFALYQNYPNPFNPSTTIKFALPVKTNLSLNVYNTLGEKVAEIFKGEMEEGYHEMMFNASSLSSGVYFYKIESESFNSTKKLMLLK